MKYSDIVHVWHFQMRDDFGADASSNDEQSSSDNGAEDDEMDVVDSSDDDDDDDNVDYEVDSDTEEVCRTRFMECCCTVVCVQPSVHVK